MRRPLSCFLVVCGYSGATGWEFLEDPTWKEYLERYYGEIEC